MKFREIERIVLDDGWFLARVKGSHHNYRHSVKKGTVTIPKHSGDIPPMIVDSLRRVHTPTALPPLRKQVLGLVDSILKQAGLK